MLRRTWIQGWMLGTVHAVVGQAWSRGLLAETARIQTGPGRLYLSLADYPALQNPGGSIQIELSSIEAPLLINRASISEWHVLDTVCTHAGCTVGKYVESSGFIQCPCHGSRYDIRGHVIRGPAEENLASYQVLFDADAAELQIEIPGLPLDVRPIALHLRRSDSLRLKLTFNSRAGDLYEVQFQSDPSAAFESVVFAVTPFGNAAETELRSTSDGPRHVYVDSASRRGFYTVVRK